MSNFNSYNAIVEPLQVIEESLEFLFQLSTATIRPMLRLRT